MTRHNLTCWRLARRVPVFVTCSKGRDTNSTMKALKTTIKTADSQRSGEIGDLDHIEVAKLAVGQVIPGEAAQEVGPEKLATDPDDGSGHDEGNLQAVDRPANEGQKPGPPQGEDQRHQDPAEPCAWSRSTGPTEGRASRRPGLQPMPRGRS